MAPVMCRSLFKNFANIYPWITGLYGVKCFIQLFFSDVTNMPDINTIPNKKDYKVFVPGSFHGTLA